MILISHRGNIDGKLPEYENNPNYIDAALDLGYDVEIDVWYAKEYLFLGHDQPQYLISLDWITERINKLWIHCKNIEAIEWFSEKNIEFNYFWHESDTITLTSKKFIWAYPGKQPILKSIAVMPEIYNDNTSECLGICSDYIKLFN
jgi:hypothetical protein